MLYYHLMGVTLAQLVKASVGQADVQGFEPHLGHNLLSCGVFLVKSRLVELRCVSCKVQALWAPSGTNHKAKLAISLRLSGWLGRYTNVEYLQKSIPQETRTITVPSLSGLNTILPLPSNCC